MAFERRGFTERPVMAILCNGLLIGGRGSNRFQKRPPKHGKTSEQRSLDAPRAL
jgi:hypothetical protein